jgi:uncharacterized protein involved in exopolysaccharide biosynthesis
MTERNTPNPKMPARVAVDRSSSASIRAPLTSDNDQLQVELLETQLRLLETRDFAIGAAAQAGEMQARAREMQLRLDATSAANHDLNVHIENHLAHIARLEATLAGVEPQIRDLRSRAEQLDRVYASNTWRIAKMMMLPVRLIRRVLKRS